MQSNVTKIQIPMGLADFAPSQWKGALEGGVELEIPADYEQLSSSAGSAGEVFAIQRLLSLARNKTPINVRWPSDLLARMPTVASLHPLLAVVACLQGATHESLGIGADDVDDFLTRARRQIFTYRLRGDFFTDSQILLCVDVVDAPGLRLLWWQCVAQALQAHIAQEQGKGDMDGTSVDANTDKAAESGTTANNDEWRVRLSPAAALRYAEAGVVLEPQVRALRADTPMATTLRLSQKSWAQGLGLWLEIEGEGRLSAAHQAAIAERFEAAGHKAPQLRHVNAVSGQRATWLATWRWEEAVWMPRDMAVTDVRRWAQDTALIAAEHWLLMRGMVALAGKPLEPAAELVAGDVKREATNEKKS